MVIAFPVIKLFTLGVKQLAKPLAKVIKGGAVRRPFIAKFICQPPAQAYHYLEVVWKSRAAGIKMKVKPLKPEEATDLGAEMLGEFFLYSVAAGTIFFEWYRSNRKDARKELQQNDSIADLENSVRDLTIEVEEQGARIREVTRLLFNLHGRVVLNPVDGGKVEPEIRYVVPDQSESGRGEGSDDRKKKLVDKSTKLMASITREDSSPEVTPASGMKPLSLTQVAADILKAIGVS